MSHKSITKEYTIWCNECSEWEQTSDFNTKSDFAKDRIKAGWRKNGDGYMCPRCGVECDNYGHEDDEGI